MTIAASVEKYLTVRNIEYDLVEHPQTEASMETAAAAHVSGEKIAKAVILKDDEGYLMAVIPATFKLSVYDISMSLSRRLELATEDELEELFGDCVVGAVPPLADAYGLNAVWDKRLARLEEVYFEGGDHANLVHVSGEGFRTLMADAEHGIFGHHT